MLLRNRMFNLFDEFFNDPFFTETSSLHVPQLMKTDIQEQDGQYLLDIELPGYKKEDIQAELKDGYLTIQARKEDSIEEKDEKHNYVRKERYSGSCKRSFYVGEGVQEEDIKAGFQDGILRIMVSKDSIKKLPEERKLIPIK